jgi:hypothetical protein
MVAAITVRSDPREILAVRNWAGDWLEHAEKLPSF